MQEVIEQEVENLRRLELIKAGDFGDLDFEKTIISDGHRLSVEASRWARL